MTSVNKIKELASAHEYELAVGILDSQDLEKSLNPQFIRTCGEVYENVGRMKEARQLYVKAHSMAPESTKIIYSLINYYLKVGYFKLAEKYFEEYVFFSAGSERDLINIKYIMKKAKKPDLLELYSMIFPYYRDNMDMEWSYELLVLSKLLDKEGLDIIASDYKATFKSSPYLHLVDSALEEISVAWDSFFIYAEEEKEDDAEDEQEIRDLEEAQFEKDYLRMNPPEEEAVITQMVADNENQLNLKSVDDMERGLKRFIKKKFKKQSAEETAEADETNVDAAEGSSESTSGEDGASVAGAEGTASEGTASVASAEGDAESAIKTDVEKDAEEISQIVGASDENASGDTPANGATDDSKDASETSTEEKAEDASASEEKSEDKSENKSEGDKPERTSILSKIIAARKSDDEPDDEVDELDEYKPDFVTYEFDDGFAPESETISGLEEVDEEFDEEYDSFNAFKDFSKFQDELSVNENDAKGTVPLSHFDEEPELEPVAEEEYVSEPEPVEEEYVSEPESVVEENVTEIETVVEETTEPEPEPVAEEEFSSEPEPVAEAEENVYAEETVDTEDEFIPEVEEDIPELEEEEESPFASVNRYTETESEPEPVVEEEFTSEPEPVVQENVTEIETVVEETTESEPVYEEPIATAEAEYNAEAEEHIDAEETVDTVDTEETVDTEDEFIPEVEEDIPELEEEEESPFASVNRYTETVSEPEPVAEEEFTSEPEPELVYEEPVSEPEPVAEEEYISEPEPVAEEEYISEPEPVAEEPVYEEPVAEPEPVVETVTEPEPVYQEPVTEPEPETYVAEETVDTEQEFIPAVEEEIPELEEEEESPFASVNRYEEPVSEPEPIAEAENDAKGTVPLSHVPVVQNEYLPAYDLPSMDFGRFSSDLFPTLGKEEKQVENKFEKVIKTESEKLDEGLKEEEAKLKEAEALLASLGIKL